MSSRISLGKVFPQWKAQKDKFDQRHFPESESSLVLYPELKEGQQAEKSRRDRVPATAFMEHLLDLHQKTCDSCDSKRNENFLSLHDGTNLSAAEGSSEQHPISHSSETTTLLSADRTYFFTPVAGQRDVGTSSQFLRNMATPGITSSMLQVRHPLFTSTPLPLEGVQPMYAPVGVPDQKSRRKSSANTKTRRWLHYGNILATESDDTGSDSDSECDSQSDEDDQPLPKGYSMLNMSTEAVVFDIEEEFDGESDEEAEEEFKGIPKIITGREDESLAKEAADALVSDKKFIAFTSQILPLLKQVYGDYCKRESCKKPLQYNPKYLGTCCKIIISCSDGHNNGIWDSQPTFRRQYAGNFLLSSSLLFSGNSYQKVSLMFKFMGLSCISSTTFYAIKRLYLARTVEDYWLEMQRKNLANIKLEQPQGAIISSDARMDSPGFSAQYCTSTFMDNSTRHIVHLEVVDVREAAGKSTNMEKIGFQRGVSYLDGIINIKQVVTDAHPQILPLMKTPDFEHIIHQIDIWHGGKSLVKRLTKVAGYASTKHLQPWIPAIRSHFWHVARECGGDLMRMKAMWLGLLHHIVDEHKWPMMSDGYPGHCDHGILDQEEHNKPWLTKGSASHQALTAVITEKRFLKKFPYFCNFQHTGGLESFHNHILMYCPKRHSYFFTGYKTRNLLAAIDHNEHVERPIKKKGTGEDNTCGHFNRRSKKWVPVAIREAKQYNYISKLQVQALMKRYKDKKSLKQKVDCPDDPRKIFPNRYMVPKPPKEDMMKEYYKYRRFQGSETS